MILHYDILLSLFSPACNAFLDAVVNSEQHMCQVPEDSPNCRTIVCSVTVTLDSEVIVMNMAVSFDSCTLSVNIKAGNKDVTITLAGQ